MPVPRDVRITVNSDDSITIDPNEITVGINNQHELRWFSDQADLKIQFIDKTPFNTGEFDVNLTAPGSSGSAAAEDPGPASSSGGTSPGNEGAYEYFVLATTATALARPPAGSGPRVIVVTAM